MRMTDPPRRTNFAVGRLLTSEALRVEQEYHRGMRYLHNRLHGCGVAEGFGVSIEQGGVRVSPGLAIDAYGRELVVTDDRFVDVDIDVPDRPLDLVLTWAEVPDLAVPGPDGEEQCTGWTEVPRLTLCAPGDAASGALLLARLSRGSDGVVTVDTADRLLLRPVDGSDNTSTDPAGARWPAWVLGLLRSRRRQRRTPVA